MKASQGGRCGPLHFTQGAVRWEGKQSRNWSPGVSDSSPGCVHCARQVGKGLPPRMVAWVDELGGEDGGRLGCSSANLAGILGGLEVGTGPQSMPGGAMELPGCQGKVAGPCRPGTCLGTGGSSVFWAIT